MTIRDTPNAPTGLTATAGPGEVMLRWDTPDPENPGIRGWQYQVQPETDAVFGPWQAIGLGGLADRTVHTVDPLPNGVEHHFKVRAYTRGYGLASEEASATPNGLQAIPLNGAVRLLWPDPGVAGLAEWQYRYRPLPRGDWSSLSGISGGSEARAQVVRNLTNDVEYGFEVHGFGMCQWK